MSNAPDRTVTLNFPACLASDFPDELPAAERAVDDVLAAIEKSNSFAPLEDRSPGLRGNDWANYLRCSEARMVHAAKVLKNAGKTSGRILDYGAYFGNFSLLMRAQGFDVDAIDAFEDYRPSLDPILDLLRTRGIQTLDFATVGRELDGLPPASYDVVLCMGVIEHIPHTPRMLLAALVRVLKPGGILLVDTPNLAQLPNRQRLSRGEPVMTPIAIQFHSSIPFEGHHREFTTDEVVWMMHEAGLELAAVDLFNYSGYGQATLTGRDAVNHWRMVANPSMREIVMVAAKKPGEGQSPTVPTPDWRERFVDLETYWHERLPPAITAESGDGIVGNELLLVDLQAGIAERDRMLAALQEERRIAVETRDAQVSELWDRLGRLQQAFDMTPGERLKRLWRRTMGSAATKPEN